MDMSTDDANQNPSQETPELAGQRTAGAAIPIGELLTDPAFPKNILGKCVDIGGYTGVVSEIVNQSIRVKSPEGVTKSFNANGLRRIYGPRLIPDPVTLPEASPSLKPEKSVAWESPRPAPPEPKKAELPEPDFTTPVLEIRELVSRPDFPQCALGKHVNIAGYVGVVVQIVNRSLKVRSQAETTRSYNADALRKLYGPAGEA